MKQRSVNQTPRQVLESKFYSARHNILLVVLFTALNIILLITNSNTYFLFSAYIPYLLADLGMYLSGRYPSEYYGGEYATAEFFGTTFFVVMMVITAVILCLYLLSWMFSKRNKGGWLIFSLVLFVIDTVLMFWINGIAIESLVDIIFHGWVIFSLIIGISAHFKLKKLPDEPVEITDLTAEADEQGPQDTPMLRFADEEVKARVLLEAEVGDYRIIYRRVKRVNELIINRRVYDEHIALVEAAHTLRACVDGHAVEAGFDGVTHSFIVVDGQIIKKKLRLF